MAGPRGGRKAKAAANVNEARDDGGAAGAHVAAAPSVAEVTGRLSELSVDNRAVAAKRGARARAAASSEASPSTKVPVLESAKLGRVPLFTDGVIICLDLEHTGGSVDVREIIQLAAVCLDTTGRVRVGAPFSEYVLTASKIEPRAGKVHGISMETLRDRAPGDFSVVGPLFVDWLAKCVAEAGASEATLVAHNGFACDFRLIAVALAKYAIELPTPVRWQLLDTLSALRAARCYDEVDDYPERGRATDKEPRGRPKLELMVLTRWLLATRDRYASAGPDGVRATVPNFCGEAHDALADVNALVVVLTDADGLWKAVRSDRSACAVELEAFLRYGVEMKAYCDGLIGPPSRTAVAAG